MSLGSILSAIFVPTCVTLVFTIMQITVAKKSQEAQKDDYTVKWPDMFLVIGVIGDLIIIAVMLLLTFTSEELPHPIFYVTLGLFIWLGAYIIVKTLTFKVVVKGEKITVYSTFKKPYTFTFSDIVSVVRQVKKNQVKSERLVIKTANGKKLIVESSEISYEKFAKKIQSEVNNEYLTGFDNF